LEPFEDENVPLFTVGQVAEMLAVKQAFLRRVDELQVVSPQRSAGGDRDELAVRLSELSSERDRLALQVNALLRGVSRDRSDEE